MCLSQSSFNTMMNGEADLALSQRQQRGGSISAASAAATRVTSRAEPRHDRRRATQRRRTSKPLKMTPLAGLSHGLRRWLSLSISQKMVSSSASTARWSRSGRFPRCPGAECEAVPRFLSPSRKCLLLLWLRCEVVTPPSAPNRNLRSGQVQRMVRQWRRDSRCSGSWGTSWARQIRRALSAGACAALAARMRFALK